MAFQREVGAGTNRATDYRDLLTKLVAFKTSQHVATVAVNVGGSGYAVGDEIVITHAGAYLDARFEVTAEAAGVITGLRITSSGAFSNRIATVAVNSGGTGYSVNDVLDIQGGTARERGKARVTTEAAGVITGVAVFETGGAYSVAPTLTAAPTLGVGPSTFAGNDDATLDLTMTGLIGTTGLATTTSGAGTGATVDITLAETGWDVTERNTNDHLNNGVDFEKQVTLVGDATGSTNKPYLHIRTRNDTSGIDEHYSLEMYGSIAHNPAIAITSQVGISPAVYLLCDEDQVQEMNFWFSANDRRSCGVTNINPSAGGTDDGEYMHFYLGYINTFATESEDPYPMYIFGSARTPNIDPSVASLDITGLSECITSAGTNPGSYFLRSEDSTWVVVENSENQANQVRDTIMFPLGQNADNTNPGNTADRNFEDGPVTFYTGIGSTNRSTPSRRLLPVPGSTPLQFPFPLTIIHKPGGTSVSQTLDTLRGQLDGVFWVYNTDDTGATITNFSEDYITIGTSRYRVFHTHVHVQLYHYICILEDVG